MEEKENKRNIIKMTHEQYSRVIELVEFDINKKWKDKIKAKIEELDDLNSPFAQRVINGKEVYLTEMIQNILQSLLEKEE